MKPFFINQRVRIKSGIAVDWEYRRFIGEITHIVAIHPAGTIRCTHEGRSRETMYQLALPPLDDGFMVVAKVCALEPVYDGDTKINWSDAGIVWKPDYEPAVIRPNRCGQKVAGSANGGGTYARHMTEKVADTKSQSRERSND